MTELKTPELLMYMMHTAQPDDLHNMVRQAQLGAAETMNKIFARQVRDWLRMDYHTMRESMASFMEGNE